MALEELKKVKILTLEIFEKAIAGIAQLSDEAHVHAQNEVVALKAEIAQLEAQTPPAPVEPVSPPAEEPPAAPADAGNAAPSTDGTAQTDAAAAQDAGGATEDPPVDGASSK